MVFFLPTKIAALAAFIALGLGGFYIDSGSNSYIADNFPEKKERLIPLLHFTYSAGALVCGYMVLPFKNQGNWNVAYGIAGLIMAVILFSSFQKPKSHSSIPVESLSEKGSIKTLLTDPDFIMYCIVILCYESAQQICSSWFPYYMENVLFAEPVIIATAGTCLWVGIAASRLLGSFILAKGVNPLAITTYGMLTSFITQLLAVATSNIPFTLAMMAVCGFASGAVIPFFIVDVNNWYPGMGRLTSVMYILSITLGRMIFPYLVTYVSSSVGLRSSLALFSLIFLSGSILAFIVKRRRISK